MKKYVMDWVVIDNLKLDDSHLRLVLSPADGVMPKMKPGQFVQLKSNASTDTFLRLPISINYVDEDKKQLWLLVQMVGEGTKALKTLALGDKLNLVLPLGNGFSVDEASGRVLLVGGGVGIAPMLYTGKVLKDKGLAPVFLLGARSRDNILEKDLFEELGELYVTTEDGSFGEKGFVTQHSVLQKEKFDKIMVCGPKPMMVAVARYANANGIPCEVSLENMMACGLGACLCCVEKTVKGNVCVCSEGPVFDIKQLTWQI
jgi:dihydroorotate dehydrogenase electron transfer subunit